MIASRAPLVEGAAAPAPGAGQGGTPRRYDLTSPAPPPAPTARRRPEVGAGRGCETAHEYDLTPCPAPTARRPPLRDATLGTLLLIAAIGVGSGGFAGLDPALFGYLGATLVAAFAVAWRASAFWRRPASAFYARALYAALRQPGRWSHLAAAASRDLVVQDFVRRRSPARWLAHLMLSLGTLASFAITLPLVFGWMHMLPAGERHYRIAVFTVPTVQFDVDGAVGWIAFHALSLAGIAVALGAAYFLLARLRTRQLPGSTTAFAVLPLLLLLVVALSGLALPASRTWPAAFRVAAWLHQASVVVLLVALPFSKLGHVLVRPLQLGARAVRRAGAPARRCAACGAPIAPVGQHAAVAALLAQRGVALGVHLDRCPPCRRRQLARVQAALVGGDFQPSMTGGAPASAASRTS